MRPTSVPADGRVDALLADGTAVRLRPITPADASELVRFHEGLSPESQRFRFLAMHPHLTPAEIELFTHVDGHDRLALVATSGGELVGVARCDRVGDAADAEVAVTVADRFQGRGVGTLLLEHLADRARHAGIKRFVAVVAPDNSKMLRVFHDAGFDSETRLDEGIVDVRLPLATTAGAVEAMARREHRAEVSSLARVLRPRGVAVVGASAQSGKVGHEVLRALLERGFTGDVHAVNRDGGVVLGLRATPDLRDVKGPVDLVVVAVPAEEVIEVVDAAGEIGAAGVVVLSAGFAETGPDGAQRERQMLDVARSWGMRIVGPNCLGIINNDPGVRLHATFAGIHPPPGQIGFYTQSGAVGIEALAAAESGGLGLSSFVSVGNKADVSGNDLLQWWEDDAATRVVGLYLESFGNPIKFRRLARRLSARKPIVALKAGRSPAGSRAAASHTAAVASNDRMVDALFGDTGVIRVPSFEELFDTLGLLSTQPLPAGPRVAVVTNSGGAGILAADALADAGLAVADIGRANPVDLRGDADATAFEQAVATLVDDDRVDALIVAFVPTALAVSGDVASALERAIGTTIEQPTKPVVGVFLAGSAVAAHDAPRIARIGTVERAAKALSRAWSYRQWRDVPRHVADRQPDSDGVSVATTSARLFDRSGPGWLAPVDCAALLAAGGVEYDLGEVVTSGAEAHEAAARLAVPVAVKAIAPGLLHKTDAGGVVLGAETPLEAARGYQQLVERLGPTMEAALVQPMAGPGEEVIIGAVRDPAFGVLVLFGAGGTRTELLADQAFRLAPLSADDAADMIAATRVHQVLAGWRGAAPLDVPQLRDLLVQVGQLVVDAPEIAELDLNPVLVGQHRLWVVDARIRLADPPTELDATRHLR
ncbi:MAG TPA: GNAT family N-acetyltransferase [Acidimicrobiales bacterium]|jgi:acyl-CoA synthetase (NDP forming)/GNAT superfamily N-acetyltransferase|nr:GNAT family N-acetyltransferase [Acidimicrobiales bacterium]